MPLAVLLATACGHDDLVPDDVYVEETTPYVELRIAVPLANPSATRANPMGGEEGNGRERGTLNEDKIHDINVFFYIEQKDAAGKGLGMDSETDIIKSFYYNLDNENDPDNSKLWYGDPQKPDEYNGDDYYEPYYEKGYWVIKLKCTEEDLKKIDQNGGVNFVAVANAGPIQDMEGKTLDNLRNTQLGYFQNSWSKSYDAMTMNASNMDYFMMSTAYNDNYTYGYQQTGDNKINKSGDEYTGTTTLQRLYARLDLWYNKTDNAITEGSGKDEIVKELKYCIVDDKDNSVKTEEGNKDFADVYITDVLPVNVMQTPSYLFKKVTNFGEDWSDWTTSGFTGKTSFKWGGKESPGNVPTATAGNDRPLNYVMEPTTLAKKNAGNSDLETWYKGTRTSVVKENIRTAGNGDLKKYYHGVPNSASDPDYGCNHISIISYANENTHPTDCFHSNYLTGMAFRAVYVPENIYTDYTMTTSTGEDGKTVTTTTLQALDPNVTSINGGKIFRYSPTTKEQKESNSLYFTSKAKAEDYAKDHPGDMAIISEGYAAEKHTLADGTRKWGFVCYYNLWLRHYNDESGDPTENYPMEYATVRNNIYRVSVSFRGPGDPEPTMREPDTMKARIFVRKWNYKEEPTINFDLKTEI